jgi:lipopolysaccharide transport system ATP-binding protein
MTAAIRTKNLTKIYSKPSNAAQTIRSQSLCQKLFPSLNLFNPKERFIALNNISLTIQKGEKVALIGRNGAGKSTLLKILSRVTAPTRGTAYIRGRVVSLLEVGTGFHPDLTGYENIFLNGSILGFQSHEVKARLDNIISFADIGDFLHIAIKKYSSGMTLRLGFSIAAHMDPDIFIIDEAFAVGDESFQQKCQRHLVETNKTSLYVSHDLANIKNICKRAIILDKGTIVKDAPIETCIALYKERILKMV